MSVVVFTDGGCAGNPGPGGWAFVLRRGDRERAEAGAEPGTTNNRMELTAVIRALEAVESNPDWKGEGVELHTDSQYVQRGITEWVSRWAARGWLTAAREPVKNQDLWKPLKALADRTVIEWRWVKGHDGNELNERCDRMVQEAIAGLKSRGM